ncbi:MAG: Mbeg1-like protein [Treponema sp.]
MKNTNSSGILEYIGWRGDLSFEQSAFNDVDAAILCQILYLNFDGFFEDGGFKRFLTLSDLAKHFRRAEDFAERCKTGVLINKRTVDLLFAAGESRRFAGVKLCGYVSVLDLRREEQFSAVTCVLKKGVNFIAYRGTDDNIIGWKEDFYLAVQDVVPAQQDAAAYLNKAASSLRGAIFVGGHSKGGNLAVYAAANAVRRIQKRITAVYNFDGPGFPKEKLRSSGFPAVIPKVLTFQPQLSIVGMLFERAGECRIVESGEAGILQHDMFSWRLLGASLVTHSAFEKASEFFRDTVNSWIEELDVEKRKIFIDTIFDILAATNARTNTDLEKNIPETSVKIISAIGKLEPDIRTAVRDTLLELFAVIYKKLPDFLSGIMTNIAAKNRQKRLASPRS